jgi:DNA-binding MarR family transcriptional regulator
MTRIYALERLLEHGPLTQAQLVEITRWPRYTITGSLRRLIQRDRIVRKMQREKGVLRCVYGLAE